MLNTYYTLQALARIWNDRWLGHVVADAFSQAKGELTIGLASADEEAMLRVLTGGAVRGVFSSEGFSRARRNSVTLFEEAHDHQVEAVHVANRDRVLWLDLSDDLTFQVQLFGPRPNIFLLDADRHVLRSFKAEDDWIGTPAPEPRSAPLVDTFEKFEARWDASRTPVKAMSRAIPLFDRTLATEAVHRAGTSDDLHRLFHLAQTLEAELLEASTPHIYWRGERAEAFALIPLHHVADLRAEPFDDLPTAVRVFLRRQLGQRRFDALATPLRQALETAHRKSSTSAERMLEEVTRPSRAERYEHWAHLLMAAQASVAPGLEEVQLDDLFGGTEPVTIPLDPRLSAVENAERYYAKARQTRESRAHAERRLESVQHQADEAGRLLDRLDAITSLSDLEAFRKEEAEALKPFTGAEAVGEDRIPFRRYTVHDGYEVWVGRNARQNDLLTREYASKHDLWMHARGVPGSHTVMRRSSPRVQPSRRAIEEAAAIAAYWSDARTSGLAPVMVTERKYVRKPKGAAPGAVKVTREEVVLVEPRLPS